MNTKKGKVMSKSKIAGLCLMVPLGLVFLYAFLWVMAWWGEPKPLFSLFEFVATMWVGLFVLGAVLYNKGSN